VVLPFLDAAEVAEAAVLAERHEWDAVFLAEVVWGIDAWVSLTAAAMRTERIRLGTMLTPLARFIPWDVASRVATLDQLSGGRVQLTVGLGAVHPGWTAFEPRSRPRRTRAPARRGPRDLRRAHARPAVRVQGEAHAGATWWIESDWSATGGSESLLRRIAAGPPVP